MQAHHSLTRRRVSHFQCQSSRSSHLKLTETLFCHAGDSSLRRAKQKGPDAFARIVWPPVLSSPASASKTSAVSKGSATPSFLLEDSASILLALADVDLFLSEVCSWSSNLPSRFEGPCNGKLVCSIKAHIAMANETGLHLGLSTKLWRLPGKVKSQKSGSNKGAAEPFWPSYFHALENSQVEQHVALEWHQQAVFD